MVNSADIKRVLDGYDLSKICVGSLGGHSALDICTGAKAEGFETVVVAERGREKTYAELYKSRQKKGCVDHVIVVDKFKDVAKTEVQQQLRDLNTIFVHSRYFWVYCDYEEIENVFLVPIFGNRALVRKEERDETKNQYFLLQKAGIKIPRQYKSPESIDSTVIVKAAEASRRYERAFFLVSSYEEYKQESTRRIKDGQITAESMETAIIEEFVVGPQINVNLFYSPLDDEVELLGTDTRRQTNIDGLLRLTAPEQVEALKHIQPKYIENGHQAVTIKESLIEKFYTSGKDFVSAVKEYYPPGMVGPFALQGAVTAGPPTEEFMVFDVSMRIPGSPGTMFTPYSGYLYGENLSVGRRIAKEVKNAAANEKLLEIVT